MADVGTLLMKFEADDAQLNKAFNNATSGIKGIGTAIVKTAKTIALGMAASTAAITAVGIQTIKLTAEQEKAESRLSSIATTVTNATEEQVQSMKELAAAYQNVSTYGDEVIITGQSQLLSFGLTTDQAEMLTGSMVDLLAANKGVNATTEDAISAANLLGKAFSGQAGSLSEVGILLNETQADILHNGTAAEKTSALVEILNQNYGGLAKTLSETTEGQMQQVKNSLGDIGEVMGSMLLPVLKDVLSWVQNNMPAIESFMTNAWASIVDGGSVLFGFIGDNLVPIFIKLYEWSVKNIPIIKDAFVKAFDKIVIAITPFYEFFKENILPILQNLFEWSISNMPTVGRTFKEVFDKMQELSISFWEFYNTHLLPILEKLFSWVESNLPAIKRFFETEFTIVMTVIGGIIDSLTLYFDTLDKVYTKTKEITGKISDAFTNMSMVINPLMFLLTREIDGTTSALEKLLSLVGIYKKIEGSTSDAYYGPTQNAVISGQKAFGGAVLGGSSYLVGERGPEIFTPGSNGAISSNNSNITINVSGSGDPYSTAEQIVNILKMQGVA